MKCYIWLMKAKINGSPCAMLYRHRSTFPRARCPPVPNGTFGRAYVAPDQMEITMARTKDGAQGADPFLCQKHHQRQEHDRPDIETNEVS
jgi:hypothetical protein